MPLMASGVCSDGGVGFAQPEVLKLRYGVGGGGGRRLSRPDMVIHVWYLVGGFEGALA